MKHNFLYNALSVIVLIIVQCAKITSDKEIDFYSIKIILLVFYLKIKDIKEIEEKLEHFFFFGEMQLKVYEIIKYYIYLLFFAHINGCIWHLLAFLYAPENEN